MRKEALGLCTEPAWYGDNETRSHWSRPIRGNLRVVTKPVTIATNPPVFERTPTNTKTAFDLAFHQVKPFCNFLRIEEVRGSIPLSSTHRWSMSMAGMDHSRFACLYGDNPRRPFGAQPQGGLRLRGLESTSCMFTWMS
jgi:hypothetical protein